jgi:hypothetical protein
VFAFYSDSISHTTFHDESIKDDTVFSVLQNITSLLEMQFPFSNIYPVLGNMDWYPKTRMTSSAGYAEFHNRLKLYGDLWSKWMPPESRGTFEKGTYFTRYSLLLTLSSFVEPSSLQRDNLDHHHTMAHHQPEPLSHGHSLRNNASVLSNPFINLYFKCIQFSQNSFPPSVNKPTLLLLLDYLVQCKLQTLSIEGSLPSK